MKLAAALVINLPVPRGESPVVAVGQLEVVQAFDFFPPGTPSWAPRTPVQAVQGRAVA